MVTGSNLKANQKRWHYLTQQYQRAKSQKQWCAIYCAMRCLLRPTQKHCVQHRKAAIDWLEMLSGNLAEIRLYPRLNSEPFQSATPSLFTH